jgi:hypothetical protein
MEIINWKFYIHCKMHNKNATIYVPGRNESAAGPGQVR